jgi:transmembrane sensor
VAVLYSRHERLVQVQRGQALFQVVHEADRQFRVLAGETEVVAVGTQFDVYRKSTITLVTVVQGRVGVSINRESPTLVSAGERATVDQLSPSITRSRVNAQQAVGWAEGQIAFDQQPLGEVAEEFNRYAAVPIVIQDEQVRAIPISGVFSARDTDSFVAFIASLDGVGIEKSGGRILVFSRPE